MEQKRIIALGFFDGVHLGHQALLEACREMAEKQGCVPSALTFSSHPDALVSGKMPGLLNTPEDRKLLLKRYGMEEVIVLPFDENMMQMPWQEFFQMLMEDYNAAGLVCGHDFRFGHRGRGNAELLQQVCRDAQIMCQVVPEQKINGKTVSSTWIRTLLEEGNVQEANRLLGHSHTLSGQVVEGRRLGHTLGFPTANVLLPEGTVCLKRGVYATKVTVEGKTYTAVTNVGSRPTVSGHQVRTESWIQDFSGDIYGKQMTISFYTFLRPEHRFEQLDDLTRSIQMDAEKSRRFFEEK